MSKNLKKNFIWNIIGTTFSAFSSLFFMIVVTRINGTNDAGIFTFAFSTACLFYVIGIYSGRTYQITDNDKNISDSDYFYSKFCTCLLMIVISILFCLIRKYDIYKFIVIIELVLYKLCEAISESSFAILQKKDNLYKVGISLFLKAVFSLLFFIIVDIITKNILIASSMLILFNIIFMIFYDFKNLKKVNFKLETINYSNIKKLLLGGFFAYGFSFLTLYVINAPKYIIDFLLTNSDQTIYGIIAMPATVLILFGQYIIQPFLVMLKEKLKTSKKEFIKLTLQMCSIILAFGAICIIAGYLLGIPILQLLYGLNLKKNRIDLLLIILGGSLYAASFVFSTSLTTMRHTKNQFVIFLMTSIVSTTLSYIFVSKYGVFGASLSYMLSMLFLLVLYIIDFFIRINKYRGDKNV